jgi:hypothetical protein
MEKGIRSVVGITWTKFFFKLDIKKKLLFSYKNVREMMDPSKTPAGTVKLDDVIAVYTIVDAKNAFELQTKDSDLGLLMRGKDEKERSTWMNNIIGCSLQCCPSALEKRLKDPFTFDPSEPMIEAPDPSGAPDPTFESAVKTKTRLGTKEAYHVLNFRLRELRNYNSRQELQNGEYPTEIIKVSQIVSLAVGGKNRTHLILTLKNGTVHQFHSKTTELNDAWKTNMERCMKTIKELLAEKKHAAEETQGAVMARKSCFSDKRVLARILSFLAEPRGVPCRAVCKGWDSLGAKLMKLQKDESSSDSDSDSSDDETRLVNAIVLDMGSHLIKVGQSLMDDTPQNNPAKCFPNPLMAIKSQAYSLPRNHPNPAAWSAITEVWKTTLAELNVNFKKTPLILSVDPLVPEECRAEARKILFDTFALPAILCESSAVLVAYSYGTLTGCIVDMGFASCRVVPIFSGSVLTPFISEVRYLSGRRKVGVMTQLLKNEHAQLFASCDPDDLDDWALGLLHGSRDPVITVRGKETKFDPSPQIAKADQMYWDPQKVLMDKDASLVSLPELINRTINKCDLDVRSQLYANILLSGGGVLGNGFQSKLEANLKEVAPHAASNISCTYDPSTNGQVAWSGGSTMTTLANFEEKWVTLAQHQSS